MNSNPSEIERLLEKIDQDTERIKYLETMIDFEQKAKKGLEKKLMVLEELQAKSSYQQSRMLRERDSMVREMSSEIDTISTRLKNSVNENIDWKKRYKKLEKMYEELEGDFFKLKTKCESLEKQKEKKKQELKQIRDVMDLYQNLKKDVQIKERWNKQEKNLICFKAQEISTHYKKLKEDIIQSQEKLKKMIIKNSRLPADSHDAKFMKEDRGFLEQKVIMLSKDNLYLKKELLRIIRQLINKDGDTRAGTPLEDKDPGANASKEEINLKGSILSFSNNNINDISMERANSKTKFVSPERGKMDEFQGSAVINVKRFKLIQSIKQTVPSYPTSLQISRNKSKANF